MSELYAKCPNCDNKTHLGTLDGIIEAQVCLHCHWTSDSKPKPVKIVKNITINSEKDFQAWLAAECNKRGILRYHTYRSMHSPTGFPDDIIILNDTMYAFELKFGKNICSPAQIEWLDALSNVTKIVAKCVYPSDMSEIVKYLDCEAG